MNRIYDKPVSDWDFEEGCVYTAEEFESERELGSIWNDCGSGYWAKEVTSEADTHPVLMMNNNDEVFSTEREDATHVIWYNK